MGVPKLWGAKLPGLGKSNPKEGGKISEFLSGSDEFPFHSLAVSFWPIPIEVLPSVVTCNSMSEHG